jgi:glycerophosphoryl diester phosphodiesterase
VAELATPDPILISSFWPASLDAAITCDPEIRTGLLVPSWFGASEALELAIEHGFGALHPEMSMLTADLVTSVHRAGLAVAARTVNQPAALRTALEWGVDTAITDDVAAARALVAAT